MANLTYPTSAALKAVEQELIPTLTQDDATFSLMPIVSEDTDVLQWEQLDNFTGVMPGRGIGGQPGRIKNTAANRFQAEVGYYGAFATISEEEITKRRKLGTFGDAINMDDLVRMRQDQLLQQYIDRMRLMVWTLLSTGAYTATNSIGQLVHSDTYSFLTATAAVSWATVATATPLADFRALKLLQRGRSTYFDKRAKAYMNLTTAHYLLANSNSSIAEIGMKRLEMGMTVNSFEDFNRLLAAQDCPQIEIYDETYATETSNTRVPFIPNNKVVVISPRKNGAPIGDICQTRNAQNPDLAPGTYTLVTDSLQTMNPVPRELRVDHGFNGGMRIYYPGSVCVLSV